MCVVSYVSLYVCISACVSVCVRVSLYECESERFVCHVCSCARQCVCEFVSCVCVRVSLCECVSV